ncbi:MAG: glycosyltransferase family 4 protein [Lachnospiraceae bacterium]|nr:glycosyltransferase family 4 protein [Lachnospiraceae bacterium]
MKIVFISNYINHHQIPFSDHMYSRLGSDYCFVQTEPMEEERVQMGWGVDVSTIPYVLELSDNQAKVRQLIDEADVVVFGGNEHFELIHQRMDENKLTFIYSERIYKEGQWKFISPRGLVRKYKDYIKYRDKNVFLLCSGAYVASDFRLIHAFKNKMLKWGYFPPFISQDIDRIIEKREKQIEKDGVVQLLWVGRMLEWKHPKCAVDVMSKLIEDGYKVHLTMLGSGPLHEEMKQYAEKNKLKQDITFADGCKPMEVREYMNNASIYLFTSDYYEGWGAVLNEAMNAGCAVVGSYAAGATRFLIRDGYNGITFNYKCYFEAYHAVRYLLDNKDVRMYLGRKAYDTIAYSWNAHIAAERLLTFCERFHETKRIAYEPEGIMSPAKAVRLGKPVN